MTRILLILIILSAKSSLSQTMNFDNAVRTLYFGVDIKKASASLVDTLMTVSELHHNDTVVSQSDLTVNMRLNTNKKAWSNRHIFSFTQSPLSGLKIESGYIEVTIGESAEIKKLLDVNWSVQFAYEKDAEIFYKKLQEIFKPLSTKQKTEYDKNVGNIAQYSTRKEGEKGVRDVSFCFGKSPSTKKYEITFSLANEFVNEN